MTGAFATGHSLAVKICGLTRTEDAVTAERAGAAYLGVILAGGPRLVSLEQARRVLGVRRPGVQRVAVFGEGAIEAQRDTADALDLDVLQLHGDPSPATVRFLRRSTSRAVWPVLRVQGTELPPDAEALAVEAGAVVLDAKVVGQLGGTGVALDWAGLQRAIDRLRSRVPDVSLVLAGGLRPDNVSTAIRLLAPAVVDVSSGVEVAPGVKAPERIADFVNAARTAWEPSR